MTGEVRVWEREDRETDRQKEVFLGLFLRRKGLWESWGGLSSQVGPPETRLNDTLEI